MADSADTTIAPAGQGTLTIADLNTTVNCEARVLDTRLGQALGFDRPRNIRKLVIRYLADLKRFGEVCSTRSEPGSQGGRPGTAYFLNRKQALYITAKSDTERAADITIQMVEVFDEYLRGTFARPALPAPWPALDRSGLALMRIGRRTVFVNTKNYRPGPKARAVVMNHDGSLAIRRLGPDDGRPTYGQGRRFAMAAPRKPVPGQDPCGAMSVSDGVWVLGAVVETD